MSQAALPIDEPIQTSWTRPTRSGSCGRNPDAGPGSCWYWYEGCPKAEQRGCFQLFASQHLGKTYIVEGDTVRVVNP